MRRHDSSRVRARARARGDARRHVDPAVRARVRRVVRSSGPSSSNARATPAPGSRRALRKGGRLIRRRPWTAGPWAGARAGATSTRRGGLARGRSIDRSIGRSVDRSIDRSTSVDRRAMVREKTKIALERPRAGTSRRRVRRAMFSVTCAPSATTTTSCAVKATARSQRVRTIDRRDADARERVRTAPEDDDGAVSPSAPHRRHRRAIERDGSGCARRWGPRGVDGDDGVDTDGREGSRARRRGETSRRPRRRAKARSGRVIQSDARD